MPRPQDLILGILICSQRCDEFIALLNSGRLCKEIARWGNKVFKTGAWRKFIPRRWQNPKPFNYLEKAGLFKRYLAEASRSPKYWEEQSGGQSSGAHWSHSVEIVLRGELNWTADEINEMPLSKAIGDYYKWLENKGMIRLMNDYEIKLIEEMEKSQGQEATN